MALGRHWRRGALRRVALLAALAGSALADDALKLTELSPNGADACFGRVYDAAHLKAHPHQKVARIFFYYGHDPVSRPNEEPAATFDSSYNAFVATTVRGAKAPEWAGGWCSHESEDGKTGPIHCGMDCDRTLASLKVDDKGSLILTDVQPDLYLDAGSEEELGTAEYDRQALGKEDDNFRLDPMPAATCKAEFARIDPVDPALWATAARTAEARPGLLLRARLLRVASGLAPRSADAVDPGFPRAGRTGLVCFGRQARPTGPTAPILPSPSPRGRNRPRSRRPIPARARRDQWRCAASEDERFLLRHRAEGDLSCGAASTAR